MVSFRLKLAFYFLALALLPLSAAFLGFRGIVNDSETRLVDAQLHSGLRATITAYDEELADAAAQAEQLASDSAFQRALARRDRRALQRIVASRPNLRVVAGDFRAGAPRSGGATRASVVLGPGGRELGSVIAEVPLDAALVRQLRLRSGLEGDEHVLVLRGARIVAASGAFAGRLAAPQGTTSTVSLGGREYRALAANAAGDGSRITLAAVSPQEGIDAARAETARRLLGVLAVTLILVVAVAYLEGRSIVTTIGRLVHAARAIAGGSMHQRVPVRGRDELALLGRTFNEMAEQLEARQADLDAERRRLREATMRFGQALAATHDTRALLRSVAETIVEATHAAGAVVRGREGDIVRVGDPDASGERMELPLTAGIVEFGRLELSKAHFEDEDREAAVLLAGQAVVALENARLHRIVERQALVDELTGLANRRQAERTLDAELTRAARFGTPVSVALVDLDGFKGVNDVYGHQAGDAVLRELASALIAGLRQFDVASRWGGEEFLLVLPGTDADGAARVAERLRAAIASRAVPTAGGAVLHVTASFGVAAYPPAGDREELVAAADGALYEAKRAGKNRVVSAGVVSAPE